MSLPPKRLVRRNLPVAYDVFDAQQAEAGPDGSLEPTPLGMVVELYFVLTWENELCPLSPPLALLLQEARLLLRRKLPHVLTELQPYLKSPMPAAESSTR